MRRSNVITDIESKTKATKNFTFKSLLFLIGYITVAYMFKDRVNSMLFVPYMIFSLCCCIFLMLPSQLNKKRNNLESIMLFFQSDRDTYRPYYRVNEELERKEELDE